MDVHLLQGTVNTHFVVWIVKDAIAIEGNLDVPSVEMLHAL